MTMHHRSTNRIEHLSHHDHRNHGIHHRNNNNHNHNHNNNDDDFGNGTNGHYTQQPQSSTTPTDTQPFLNHSTAPRRHPPTATAEGDESKNERFIETMIKIFIGLFAITAFSISYNVSSGNGIAGYYSGVGGRGGDGTSSISRRNGNTYMGTNVVGKLRTPSDGSKDQLQSRYESHSESPLPLQSQQSQPTTPSKQILYPLPHSYPAHWPSYRLPGWATKTYDSIDAFDPSTDIPDGKRVCFVHVGKTAGSTVGCALGFHLHCGGDGSAFAAVRPVDPSREEGEEEEGDGRGGNETVAVWEEPYRRRLPSSSSSSGRHNAPGLLAKYTTNIFHTNIYDCPDPISPNDTQQGKDYGREATNYYLFLVRNPLHRLLSAHAYDRPSNWEGFQNGMTGYYDRRKKLYADCPFTTLEDLARLGLGDDENGVGTVSEECRTRAREAVLGTSHFGCHFYYNYQYHWEGIPNHLIDEGLVKIVTIRTEHLERDWNSIEVELGGGEEYIFMGGPSPSSSQPQQQQTLHNNVNTKALHTDKYLSYESKSLLCHYLCNEIQIYKLILSKSLNLDEREIRRSIDELKQDCPLQADLDECPAPLPNGKTKLLLDRGYGTEQGEEWKSPPKREPTPAYVTKKIVRPYEAHWGLPLPSYMKKDYEKYLSIVPEDQRVCFVHVGKTAGSSVGCALGFRLHCGTDGDGVGVEEDGLSRTIGTNETTAAAKSSRLATPGLLPQYSTHMFHAQIYDCFDRSAHYLFVVRNPLHRLISAYNYDKPRNWERSKTKNPRYYEMTKALYVDCGFDTLEDLASNGLSPQGNSSEVCRERAASSILGTGRFGNHIYYNYQFHLEAVPKGANILVLRTEHLAEDWNAAERFVSGRENILGEDPAVFPHNNVNSNSDVKAKHLSDESRVLVCEKLCNEIQVYKKILSSATNLNEEQMKQSLEELKESCPVETMAATCRDPLPDITEKLVKGRGYEKETIPKPFTGEISVGREVYSQPPHPYELAWPKLRLPSYMRKDPEYDLNLAPKDKKTCFVHVGKTAGSTIGCAIGFNLHCATKIKAPGLLPLYATNMFHAQMYDCHDDSAYFVFVVRHPLDRLVSAFNYDKPSDWDDFRKRFGEKHYNFRKRLYRDCPFESMEDVARLGLSNRGTASGECMRRAAASIEGTEHFGCHSYFNYQFHLEAVPENATLMTIRTEHLVEDYNSVEYHLGGEPHVLGPNQTVLAHNNENKAIGEELKHLSEESKKLVCDKLCNEIQVYKEILRRSINLSEEQVEESIRELNESCPRETEAVSCVQPLPDITDKLVNSRGYISSKKGRRRGKSEMERNVGMN